MFISIGVPVLFTTPYFFSLRAFAGIVACFSITGIICERLEKTSAALISGMIAATFFVYGCFEVVYALLPSPAGWVEPQSGWYPLWRELYSYAGNRALQVIPIAALAGLLAFHFPRLWQHRCRIGQPDSPTTILGSSQPQSWKQVAGRLAFYLTIVTVGFLVARGGGSEGSGRLMLFCGRLIGGTTNSLIEELLFRGILQPVFESVISLGAANALQAVFFAVIHFGYVETLTVAALAPEVGRILLYTGIGWFLGRAARETNGLLIPWFFHALVTAAIWVLLTVQGS